MFPHFLFLIILLSNLSISFGQHPFDFTTNMNADEKDAISKLPENYKKYVEYRLSHGNSRPEITKKSPEGAIGFIKNALVEEVIDNETMRTQFFWVEGIDTSEVYRNWEFNFSGWEVIKQADKVITSPVGKKQTLTFVKTVQYKELRYTLDLINVVMENQGYKQWALIGGLDFCAKIVSRSGNKVKFQYPSGGFMVRSLDELSSDGENEILKLKPIKIIPVPESVFTDPNKE